MGAAQIAAVDPGGIERGIARQMPVVVLGMVAILGVLWWLAAQPPPGPGWGNPQGPPQQQWPQQGQPPPQNYPQNVGPSPGNSGCSFCAADCLTGIDCADCVECGNCIDCGDCLSGIDCVSCTVSGATAAAAAPEAAPARRSCSTNPWKRLSGSAGLLLPLFILVTWRRRLHRAPAEKNPRAEK